MLIFDIKSAVNVLDSSRDSSPQLKFLPEEIAAQ
jgi:hypothetical protein